jgi:outer membrane cobalamin receptor
MRSRQRTSFSFTFFFTAVSLITTRAQTPPAPVVRTSETVVVTATGREAPQSTVGASLTVIKSDQIEQRHALSTIDLLRIVPGAVASRPGGIGNLTAVWVRGGESTYNKVLIDGVALNEPGGAFNFAAIAPENIERVEVLRGAHSALFGSDAMASVIQMFSARPEEGRPRFDLTFDGGTYGTGHAAAGLGSRTGGIEYRLFGSRLETDNREPNNEHRMTTLSGSFGARTESGAGVRLLGRGDLGDTGVPGATAFGPADMDARSEHTNADFMASWDQPIGGRVLQRASYALARSRQESINLAADPPYTPQFGSRRAPFQFFDFLYHSTGDLRRHHVDYRADFTIRAGQMLTAAFTYEGERGVLTDHLSTDAPQRPSRDNTGTTVQYEREAGPVSIVGGVRFENNGSFGFYAAPRASASWLVTAGGQRFGSTRIHSSGGLGIKEPTFLQSYSPNVFFLGNPDLDPERSGGYDIGLEQRLAGDRIGVDVTYFANRFEDLISLRTVDPTTFSSQYFNIGETRADGVELAAHGATAWGLQLHGSYTFLSSKVVRSTSDSPIFTAGQPLLRRPRHSGSVQANYVRGRLTATAGAMLVGKRADTDSASLGMTMNEGHALLNTSLGLRLARRTSAFVTIDNAGDDDYMDPLGFRGLGRTMRGGIRTRF